MKYLKNTFTYINNKNSNHTKMMMVILQRFVNNDMQTDLFNTDPIYYGLIKRSPTDINTSRYAFTST